MKVLVTGGAGYIGSHTCLELLEAGHQVVVIDNLVNSSEESLRRVRQLTGRDLEFHHLDLLDRAGLAGILAGRGIEAVIHLAGLKAVGESVEQPLAYYQINLAGTLVLCEVMAELGINNLVFSSSATVYGNPATLPIREDFPLSTASPYARCKLFGEEILHDLHRAAPSFNVAILRYFNPVGAHSSGRIGEDPQGHPNNLMPYLSQVAIGKRPELLIFGNDYSTPDGTGVRDYIHVVDLAKGHLRVLEKLRENPGVVTYNLGTGRGYSVLEMVAAFAKACGHAIPYRFVGRRAGDIAVYYTSPALAAQELGWRAERSLEEMCQDTWRWQTNNPEGYR